MPAVRVTGRFRSLVAGLTDVKGFEALMLHIRASSSEGFCPVCAGDLQPDPDAELGCRYGDTCTHGKCAGCGHSSHYDQAQEPDLATLTDADIRGTKATLDEMIRLLDAGHGVTVRPI